MLLPFKCREIIWAIIVIVAADFCGGGVTFLSPRVSALSLRSYSFKAGLRQLLLSGYLLVLVGREQLRI